MVHVRTPNQPDIPDTAALRCGVQRESMRTNVLIHKPGFGEVSKVTFTNPSADKVFGVPKLSDPESARDLIMLWKEHSANPDDDPAAGPDFLAMNKRAAIKGLTTAGAQKPFRKKHPVWLKKGEAVKRPPPLLPSDTDPEHVYGMPGTYRSAEQIRNAGPGDPPMKPLIQSQYSEIWSDMNRARSHEFDTHRNYIVPKQPSLTRAAQALKNPPSEPKLFKMNKFSKVEPRVVKFMGGKASSEKCAGQAAS